ncbi:MAG: hypothetical protein FJ225_03795 [Lentisphaerae bacterium]|nr:hypothetical protein [Lentisphaerota bacterium]
MSSRAIRLQKYLAERGVASRRACEALMAAGRVTVNGEVVTRPGTRVDPDRDAVTVDGTPLAAAPKRRTIMLYKPRGYICSASAKQGRTVYELLPEGLHPTRNLASRQSSPGGPRPTHGGPRPTHGGPRPTHGGPRPPGAGGQEAAPELPLPAPGGRGPPDAARPREGLVPIGRLDKDSEGLLLMSNDGELVHRLSHPRFEHAKTYRVTVSALPGGRAGPPDPPETEQSRGPDSARPAFAGKLRRGKPEALPYPSSTPSTGRARAPSFARSASEGKPHAPVSGRPRPTGEDVDTARGVVTDEMLQRLRQPFVLDGYRTRPTDVRVIGPGLVLEFVLKEGRKRQIRRMCEHVGLRVERLMRVGVGPLELGNLCPGRWRELSSREVEQLTESRG